MSRLKIKTTLGVAITVFTMANVNTKCSSWIQMITTQSTW